MRLDDAPDHDVAARTAALDLLDAEPDEPVVDEHVVPGLEHRPEHGRAHGQVVGLRRVLAGDHDRVAVRELEIGVEIADAELRPLQVGDQRDRPPGRGLRLTDESRGPRVVVLRAVGEVEAGAVHAGLDQRGQDLRARRRRPDGRDDLRAAGVPGHGDSLVALSRQAAERGNAAQPGNSASSPSSSSIRSSWLYFATRSERVGAPVLI